MRTLAELRAEAREHARQLEAVRFLTVRDLADRYGVDEDTVRLIPRERLPFLEFGKSNRRRFDPRDVEEYERRAKAGEFALPGAGEDADADARVPRLPQEGAA